MDWEKLVESVVEEVNRLREDPVTYLSFQSDSEHPLTDPPSQSLGPLSLSPPLCSAMQSVCESLKPLYSDFSLDCTQQIYPELQQRGVWLGSIGHSIFPLVGAPRSIVMSLLADETVPMKGRKANLLNPHFELCGFGVVRPQREHEAAACVMVFVGDFLPDLHASAQKFDRARTKAPADLVVQGGWKGSVLAVSADKRLFRDLTERWETDLPEGAVSVSMKRYTIRTREGRSLKTRKEYQMRDGQTVLEEETLTL